MSKRNRYEQPSLPEGYYFRVSEHYLWDTVDVAIMRKRWPFDKEVNTTSCSANTTMIAVVMNELKDRLEERNKREQLLGDYPPKKLGDT